MSKDTRNILLIGGGVAVLGVILYMVFAPSGTSNTVVYTSGTALTNSSNPATAAEGAALTEAQMLLNKWFGVTPTPAKATS